MNGEPSWLERIHLMPGRIGLLSRSGVERELMPAMQAYGLGLLPYSPLGSGLLSGKYKHHAPMPERARLTRVQPLADKILTENNRTRAE